MVETLIFLVYIVKYHRILSFYRLVPHYFFWNFQKFVTAHFVFLITAHFTFITARIGYHCTLKLDIVLSDLHNTFSVCTSSGHEL